MVGIGVEDGAPWPNLHMFSCGSRYIRALWYSRFIDPLCGFDDLIETRCDFGWGNASTENVACWDGGAVEFAVGVLALDKRGTLERNTSKQA